MRKSTVAFPVASALVACALFLAASRAVVAEDRAVTVDGTGTSGQAAQTGPTAQVLLPDLRPAVRAPAARWGEARLPTSSSRATPLFSDKGADHEASSHPPGVA